MSVPHEPIMQFFAYDHLPAQLRDVSQPFCELARWIERTLPRNAERTVALRKLLEGKDAAVRAMIATPPPSKPPAESPEPLPEPKGA